MSKELIVSVNGREKKIAIIEDDVVTEFYVERGDENQGIVGNIYKGRVMKVLPGMQSAFVDIGLERDSFLYVSDFFDEEEIDEEEPAPPQPRAAAARDRQRPAREPREPREAAYAPMRLVEEEDQEAELAATALRHIEELSEEPEIEPAPGDELLTATGVPVITSGANAVDFIAEEVEAPVPARDARQRRRNRLRVAEPEPEEIIAPLPAEAPEAEVEPLEMAEAAGEAADTEEEAAGRRPRRRRRRRGSAAEAVEAEIPEAADAVETAEAAASPTAALTDEAEIEGAEVEAERKPFVIVHHNPYERIMDDELDPSAGELLKDAMLQERIAEQVRAEEFRTTTKLEVEPTPEVKVGSLTGALELPPGFERISDEEAAEAEAAERAALAAEALTENSPTKNSADAAAQTAVGDLSAIETNTTEVSSEVSWPEPERRTKELPAEALTYPEDILEAPESVPAPAEPSLLPKEMSVVELLGDVELLRLEPTEEQTTEPLSDASAEVRQRPRRGEMAATRRGGRGRRRGFQQRRPVTEATADAEDYVDPGEEEAEVPAYVPAPPVSSRSSNPQFSQPSPSSSYGSAAGGRYQRPVITDLLREGQEIIVQIAKEPIGQKGARITSHVALPGRYIVYMPTVEHIGVSRKIGTDEERQRLKRTLHTLRAEAGATGGFIVRTAAHGCTTEELRDDMQYLVRTWNEMRRRADRVKAPAIIHRDLDLVQRILRDQLSGDFTAIRVDNELEYERMVDFVNRFAPKLVNRVKLYTKDTPILEHYGVQAEIDKAVKPRVWLKSGGYIVINQTEALVAIDVNTGKFVGKSNRLEDTIVKTNLEAAKEIVRQIRLRDLGGIIVLDFIDMEERRNRQKVLQALEYEMRSDKAPSKVLQFNDFGLVAVTRKRVKQSLERTLCTPCNYCGGGGMVKSPQTVSYEILAEARRISKDVDDANEVILRVHPDVAKALRTSERDVLQEIEAYLGGVVSIKSDPAVHQEQFDIALS
jgi:ribonuclease G